jgi:transketolase
MRYSAAAMAFSKLDQLCVNTIRTLSIDAVQKANSGHPGMPLGAAPMAYVLWQRHLRFSASNPNWMNRDRFVLSAGHGSIMLYSLLHLYGYDVTMDDIKNFRQLGSKTPGHPEAFLTPGVEATTGPLGQGAANIVGMAMAERKLANLVNEQSSGLIDHYSYAIVSDGDLMEGVSQEAASLAAHLRLGKLICLYDANEVTLDGPSSMCFSTESVADRYRGYGWHVLYVNDGDTDLDGIDAAIEEAKKDDGRPSLIVVRTTIGFGSPNKAGKSSSHGSPLGVEELAATKAALGWSYPEPFTVPAEAKAHFNKGSERAEKNYSDWKKKSRDSKTLTECTEQNWSAVIEQSIPTFAVGDDMASREASGKVLNQIAKQVPWLFGGDADLGGSTMTVIKEAGSFNGTTGAGRNIHYGVREHAMAAAANGIAYHGGLRSFTATFFCFADYMRPSIRLAAMNHLPVIYVFTHDSIGLGEDGPTHQPVEHLMSLRVIPGLVTLRPCDANETREAWIYAMNRKNGPTALILSRQKLKTLDRALYGPASGLHQGAYILSDTPDANLILMATGSEVGTALEAKTVLEAKGQKVRVVSVPSLELFLKQPEALRESVLPSSIKKRVSIEAGVTLGWRDLIGDQGLAIGIDTFGASAPAPQLYKKFGLDTESVCTRITEWLK